MNAASENVLKFSVPRTTEYATASYWFVPVFWTAIVQTPE